MKRTVLAFVCLAVEGCSNAPLDDTPATTKDIGETQQALDFAATKALTKKQGGVQSQNEAQRETLASQYYDTVLSGFGGTIRTDLSTLQSFIDTNFFDLGRSAGRPLRTDVIAPPEENALYYNRGDLGIGRDMHCVDNVNAGPFLSGIGNIACYVRNFAAGDADKEFQFGLSSNIALFNAVLAPPFATVAMVFRRGETGQNNVYFIVYDAAGNLANKAALDRSGLGADKHFDQGLGVAGTSYNNHIPTNCINCHGGNYQIDGNSSKDSFFLPFDTEQFEVVGDQSETFKRMNEMVWKVDQLVSRSKHPVVAQLDAWYNNLSKKADPATENFENNFDTTGVVAPPPSPQPPAAPIVGWGAAADKTFYQSVLRHSCRNCHMTNDILFDSKTEFLGKAPDIVADICNYVMPDALQTLRLFWQSSQPAELEAYLRANGKTAEANQLHACGPANVATLDPPALIAALAPL